MPSDNNDLTDLDAFGMEVPSSIEAPEDFGGEQAGETDVSPDAKFFVSKKAAAVLKHGILKRYIKPWAAKVGSTADDKRVVYIDGYAGPGRYADETPGSPQLVLETARSMDYRNLECHFVEKTKKFYGPLSSVVAQAQQEGVNCQAYRGSLEVHLENLLALTNTAPLFTFLDPFGLAISFEDIAERIMGGARGPGSGRKTEVLLNFSANAVRRIGGLLDESRAIKGRDATLQSMDSACGGSWWREMFVLYSSNEQRVEEIADEFMRRIAARTQSGGWSFPVRNRATLQPVYHLVYLSRHPDGMWLFGDCLAGAQQDWRRHLSPPPIEDEETLFPLVDPFPEEEQKREDMWKWEIKSNITQLLQTVHSFSLIGRYQDVLGSTVGLVREPLIRQAVKELHMEGVTSCQGIGRVSKLVISR